MITYGFCTFSVLPHFAFCCYLQKVGWKVRGLILTTLAAQGAGFCSANSGTEGRGLSLGQRSQSLAEGKEGVQGGWSGVWQAVLGQQRLAAVGRVPSCLRSPLHPVSAHTLASILESQCPGQGEQAIGTCFLPLGEIFWRGRGTFGSQVSLLLLVYPKQGTIW